MEKTGMEGAGPSVLFAGEAWFDPIESGIRGRIRELIEELVEQELAAALGRARYERCGNSGHRHGHGLGRLTGSFGPVEISVPRARLRAADGTEREWRSTILPRYARRPRQMEALIASAYLSGTTTRRVQRALAALFTALMALPAARGAVGKEVVSRAWRKVKADWDAWCRRDLRRGGHRAADPGRHGGEGAARPQGHFPLGSGGARHPA